MKELILNVLKTQLQRSFDILFSKKFNEIYQAGLTDVRGPKPMKFRFFKDKVQVTYMDNFIFHKSFTIWPKDIVEVELVVEDINTTGKALTGAIAGNLLAGPLGAIALAGHASKQNKEDVLKLVINYKGESRPLVLQSSKNTQKMYGLLKQMK